MAALRVTMAARAIRMASDASTAASATQRSCWRSMPRARRKRTTSDSAPTTTAMTVTPTATRVILMGTSRARSPNGFVTDP
jgi:hypothetical protein